MKDQYDFVVIDTPPALGLITVNALVAATHLLIPVQSSYFALEGTDDLLETVDRIRARPNPDLKLLGAVITLHDKRTTLARDVHKAMSEVFGGRVFVTTISQEHPPRGEPGAPRVDLHVRAAVERRLRVLQAVRGGHRTCLAPGASVCPRRSACGTTRTSSISSSARAARPIGRLIPIEDIAPNPDQPRQALGDLDELTASIREKGVLEPHPGPDGRDRASRSSRASGATARRVEAGLGEMPCVVRDTSDAEMMELALIENLQRKDLTRVRRGRRPEGARRQVRLHARIDGREAGQEPLDDHRIALARGHARGRAAAMSACRHSV